MRSITAWRSITCDGSVRLVDYKRMQWQDRAYFFAVAAQLMRRILVERARRRNLKRGGGEMNALARFDPRKVQVVEMRFFGGLSLEETAEVLKISSVTVRRDLRTAKVWLYREITGDRESTGGSTDGLGTPETNR